MKKIYTLALAALCALGASAADGLVLKQFSAKKVSSLNASVTTMEKIQAQRPDVLKPMADEDNQSVAGQYTISIGDYYFQDSQGLLEEEATVTLDGTTLTIQCEYFPMSVEGTFDEATGEISFQMKKLGAQTVNQTTYYIRFEPFVYADENINAQTITAQWDAETQQIIFAADNGFSWVAYSNQLYASPAGYLELFDVVGMSKGGAVEDETWVDYCTGTFIDGWILPAITYQDGTSVDPNDYPLFVNIQQNVNNANLYRLVDPYHSENFPLTNNAAAGYIEFSLEDPDFVLVLPGVYSGFSNGSNKVNAFNLEGFYTEFGYGKDEILEGVEGMVPSTFDGQNTVSINNCRFNYPTVLDKAYSWNNASGESLASKMVSSITFDIKPSAIGSIATDDSNAPVEYFNLQGVKLANPEAGQIVIRRQGSQVSKVFVK